MYPTKYGVMKDVDTSTNHSLVPRPDTLSLNTADTPPHYTRKNPVLYRENLPYKKTTQTPPKMLNNFRVSLLYS